MKLPGGIFTNSIFGFVGRDAAVVFFAGVVERFVFVVFGDAGVGLGALGVGVGVGVTRPVPP
jgi:hypothetical protein